MTSDSSDSPAENLFFPPEGLDGLGENETSSQEDFLETAKRKEEEANAQVAQLKHKIEAIGRVRDENVETTEEDRNIYNEEVGEEGDPEAILATLEADQDTAENAALEAKEELERQKKSLTPEGKLSIAIDDGMKILKGKPSIGDTIKAIMMMLAALQRYFKYIKGEFAKATGKEVEEEVGLKKKRGGDPRARVRSMLAKNPGKTASQLKAEKETIKGTQEAAVRSAETSLTTAEGKRPAAQRELTRLEAELAESDDSDATIEGKITDARRALDQIDADITAAKSRLATAESELNTIKADIKDIDDAVAKAKADVNGLSSFFRKAAIQLRAKNKSLGDLFGEHLNVRIGTNGIDITITSNKEGVDMEDILEAFSDAKMNSDLEQLDVDVAANKINDPEAFMEALQRLVRKA